MCVWSILFVLLSISVCCLSFWRESVVVTGGTKTGHTLKQVRCSAACAYTFDESGENLTEKEREGRKGRRTRPSIDPFTFH